VRGVGGVPEFFFWLKSLYFCYLGAHAKFQNPTKIPSGRISNEPGGERERKKEREKMPFIVATYVYASSQGQRTHSARTNFQNISSGATTSATQLFRLSPNTISNQTC
jgi:hypothetical protein